MGRRGGGVVMYGGRCLTSVVRFGLWERQLGNAMNCSVTCCSQKVITWKTIREAEWFHLTTTILELQKYRFCTSRKKNGKKSGGKSDKNGDNRGTIISKQK